MPAGRPTKYNEEILTKTRDYIDGQHEIEGDVVPSIAGLACSLGTHRETLHSWARDDDKQEFSYMLRELLSKQERLLLAGGLTGKFTAPISKLMLAKHDYSDTQKTELQALDKDGNKTDLNVGVKFID